MSDPIDAYVHGEMRSLRLPGVALAITLNGRPLSVRTYGLANIELESPVTADSVFRIASIGKQILASAIMLLVRDGKIRLESSICNYLGDCSSWMAITIRHLLTHTSGMEADIPGFNPFRRVAIGESLEVIRSAARHPVHAVPGRSWLYSNLGYSVLAEVICVASGMPWPEYVSRRIFEPLQMRSTRIADMMELVPLRVNGYVLKDNKLINATPLIALRAGGAFLSSLSDMMKWDSAIDQGALIPSPVLQRMWTPERLEDGSDTGYGFGFRIDQVGGHRRVRHGGAQPGFKVEYCRFVDARLGVIVLVNCENARPEEMAMQVAEHFIAGLRR